MARGGVALDDDLAIRLTLAVHPLPFVRVKHAAGALERMLVTRPLVLILAVTLGLLGYRFVVGLGAVTNLSDKWPWSFWTWWKLSAVSLSAGTA